MKRIVYLGLLILVLSILTMSISAGAEDSLIGKSFFWGSYPQTKNGKDDTPIEWIILDVQDDKVLLISKYALDAIPYNEKKAAVTWETSSLRKWLVKDFFNKAFTAEEKQKILYTKVTAEKNATYKKINAGNETADKVFVLSISEARKYFSDDAARMSTPTAYALMKGALTGDYYKVGEIPTCLWWLRSPGSEETKAANVGFDGTVANFGYPVNGKYAVRPSIWVNESTVREQIKIDSIKQVGNIISFGAYPQTGDGTDSTPIEWIVTEVQDDKVLLVSKYVLDAVPYNEKGLGTTWEHSTLRTWLNGEFYDKAFTERDKAGILLTEIVADKNPEFDTDPGNDTKDNVFLLSYTELNKYYADVKTRICMPTEYAAMKGVWTSSSSSIDGKAACSWWIRTPGGRSFLASNVRGDGSVLGSYGADTYDRDIGVRPCVWVRPEGLSNEYMSETPKK